MKKKSPKNVKLVHILKNNKNFVKSEFKKKTASIIESNIALSPIDYLSFSFFAFLACAIVGFVKKALGISDINARCNNFRAVPGCGLSVTVSHIEEMEAKGEQDQEMMKFLQSTGRQNNE